MTLIRRNFTALKHPKGSPEQAELNREVETSEYFSSDKWVARDDAGQKWVFRTKNQAEQFIANQ